MVLQYATTTQFSGEYARSDRGRSVVPGSAFLVMYELPNNTAGSEIAAVKDNFCVGALLRNDKELFDTL